jgi:hypothetical protein
MPGVTYTITLRVEPVQKYAIRFLLDSQKKGLSQFLSRIFSASQIWWKATVVFGSRRQAANGYSGKESWFHGLRDL